MCAGWGMHPFPKHVCGTPLAWLLEFRGKWDKVPVLRGFLVREEEDKQTRNVHGEWNSVVVTCSRQRGKGREQEFKESRCRRR